MFQDEARFGRISVPQPCWAPKGVRPEVPEQLIREYVYVYSAVSPKEGQMDSLILPDMYRGTLSVFLEEVSRRYPQDEILMVMDNAPCHRAGDLHVPGNITLFPLPPYSPSLNPQENIWDEMREKYFGNRCFKSMDALEQHLVNSLNHMEANADRIRSITNWPWIMDAIS